METGNLNGLFGKVAAGLCRITINGNIAIKTGNGYKTYNVEKQEMTNVNNFCFDFGGNFFFIMPTTKVNVGDIILIDRKPKCVIEVGPKIITVIDYETSEVRQILPERHVFMGNTYFYGKLVSMFGNIRKKVGAKNMIKMMMAAQMMGNNNTDNNAGLGQMMAMSMLMGKDGNLFDDMFDNDDDNENDNNMLNELIKED